MKSAMQFLCLIALSACTAMGADADAPEGGEAPEQGKKRSYFERAMKPDALILISVVVLAALSSLWPSLFRFCARSLGLMKSDQEAKLAEMRQKRRGAMPKRGFSLQEMKACNGTEDSIDPALVDAESEDDGRRLYVCCKGVVFDVTSNMRMYGPDAGYYPLTHCDGTVAFAKVITDVTDEIQTRAAYKALTHSERESMHGWLSFFLNKYNVVGWLTEGCVPRKGMPDLDTRGCPGQEVYPENEDDQNEKKPEPSNEEG